jgi:hypothetical protein
MVEIDRILPDPSPEIKRLALTFAPETGFAICGNNAPFR